jgi:amino acid transporter
MLGSPRAWYAFGRAGVLPEVMTRIHPIYHTPYVAIIVYACVVAALAISSSFTQLAVLANVAALTLYLMCVAASFELQRRDIRADGTPFAAPGGPLIPIAAGAVILWLLSNATRREFLVEAVVLVTASLIYSIRTRVGQR